MKLLPCCIHRSDKFIKWDCHASLAMTSKKCYKIIENGQQIPVLVLPENKK